MSTLRPQFKRRRNTLLIPAGKFIFSFLLLLLYISHTQRHRQDLKTCIDAEMSERVGGPWRGSLSSWSLVPCSGAPQQCPQGKPAPPQTPVYICPYGHLNQRPSGSPRTELVSSAFPRRPRGPRSNPAIREGIGLSGVREPGVYNRG